jgi:hypothetical protein
MNTGKKLITSDPELLKEAGWNDFVCSHPDGNFFQLPIAYDLFCTTEGYTPEVIGIIDHDTHRIQGVLLTVLQQEKAIYRSLTRRSIAWGGPLTVLESEAFELLQEYDRRSGNRAIYTQIRNLSERRNVKEAFQSTGFTYKPHLTSLVITKDLREEDVLNRMSKSRARQIRKGLEHAEITEATSETEFKQFHEILKQLYRHKVRKPLPHHSFFDNFRKILVPAGAGKLLVVKKNDTVIGGILCAIMPGKTIYEWYIAGLDDEYKDIHPSVLATWAAIRYAIREQLDHFDFLGAGSPDSAYGVRDFKERFGGETVEYGRFERVHQPVLMKIGTFGLRMKQWIR